MSREDGRCEGCVVGDLIGGFESEPCKSCYAEWKKTKTAPNWRDKNMKESLTDKIDILGDQIEELQKQQRELREMAEKEKFVGCPNCDVFQQCTDRDRSHYGAWYHLHCGEWLIQYRGGTMASITHCPFCGTKLEV